MRKKFITRCAVVCMAAVMTMSPVNASAATLLKKGSSGSGVKTVQSELKDLGYYTYSKITGYYGSVTAAAVRNFQKEHGLLADGIVGKHTLNAINKAIADESKEAADESMKVEATVISSVTEAAITVANTYSDTADASVSADGNAAGNSDESTDESAAVTPPAPQTPAKITGAFDWYKKVQYIWKRGENAVVTDVDTGLSFTVKRTYGSNHADIEPLTKADTQTIKKIWGGFSWERRAVTVEVGDYVIAASMTAMPHAGVDSARANAYVHNRSAGYGYGVNLDTVKSNGASGVMDIHFLNSRTHSTNVVQKSQQDMVKKAAVFLKA